MRDRERERGGEKEGGREERKGCWENQPSLVVRGIFPGLRLRLRTNHSGFLRCFRCHTQRSIRRRGRHRKFRRPASVNILEPSALAPPLASGFGKIGRKCSERKLPAEPEQGWMCRGVGEGMGGWSEAVRRQLCA